MTALLEDSDRLAQLRTSLNSALELAQQSGLNLQALANALDSAQDSAIQTQLSAQAEMAQTHLKLPPGSNAVVTNGRVIVMQSDALGVSDVFTSEDFGLLVRRDATVTDFTICCWQGLLQRIHTVERVVNNYSDPECHS